MNKKRLLTKADILGAQDLSITPVEVPEWLGTVFVRCMTASERERFEAVFEQAAKDKRNVLATLLAYTVCDQDGALLFTPEEVEALSGKSTAALLRLHTHALRLNVLTKDDIEQLGNG